MRTTWPLTIVVVVLAALAAFGIAQWAACPRTPVPLNALNDVNWLARQLQLSPAQVREVRQLQSGLQRELQQCDLAHCAARCRLADVLFGDTNTWAGTAAVDEMCRMQAEGERATLAHIRKVHKLLTPEQQKKYEDLVTTCVCSSCPHTPTHRVKP